MAYTPELTYQSSCTLRRIAWALDVPMTQAIERVFDEIVYYFDRTKVCESCRDKTKCDSCGFSERKEVRKCPIFSDTALSVYSSSSSTKTMAGAYTGVNRKKPTTKPATNSKNINPCLKSNMRH